MLLEFVEKMLMQAESCSLNMLRRLKKMNQSHLKHLSHGTYMIDQLMAETVDEELRRLKIEAKKKLPLSSKNKLLKNHIIKKPSILVPQKSQHSWMMIRPILIVHQNALVDLLIPAQNIYHE